MPPIGPQSKITLGTAAAVLIALMSSVIYVRAAIADLTYEVQSLKVRSYTLEAASEQALRMAIENPGMRVPDPRRPGNVLCVEVRN